MTLETQNLIAENKVKLHNHYGPSETHVVTTLTIDSKNNIKGIPTIGTPIANNKIFILDKMMNKVPINVQGEMYISGDSVARGYLNREELTKERFIENPFGEGKLYKTGDLARWLSDGNIEYLGRADQQIKIRGFRIELGEITNAICKINYVKDAAVINKKDRNGEEAIYAYIVSEKTVDIKDIKKELKRELPEYMVPAYMMEIDSLPLNRNGKLDKRALPDIVEDNNREYIVPRTEMEKMVVSIFEEIIGIKEISVDANFFEIGGHSLRATRVVNRIEAETSVRVPIKVIFSEKTAEGIAKYIENIGSEQGGYINRAEKKEYYLMSSIQKRVYLIWKMDKESTAYNMPMAYKLEGKVNEAAVKEALEKLIKRHEILRTSFAMKDEEFIQKVNEKVEIDYSYEENENQILKVLESFTKAFDLDNGNLLRMKLVKNKEDYYLLIDMHHIVSDGMSMGIFINEFSKLYNGENLQELKLQYKDYSEWMNKRDLNEQKEYWVSKFVEEVPVINLPYDYNRPSEQSYEGEVETIVLSKDIKKGIEDLCKQTGATEYMILLASYMITLNKYTAQEDIVVGTPISGRTNRDMESMMGMFVNTLAMREKPEGNKRIIDFIYELKESCLKAYENQEYPFEELVEAVKVRRDLSRNPLFDVMFNLQNNEVVNLDMNQLEISQVWGNHKVSKFDLSVIVENSTDVYYVGAEYCRALFKKETIERFLVHFKEVISNIISKPEGLIGEINILTNEEELTLDKFNDTFLDFDKEKTIVDIFEEKVKEQGDGIAVSFKNNELTYKELNEKANSLASILREKAVTVDSIVAIKVDRSIEMIISIIAILKAGGAYLPIDETWPKGRIEYILKNSNSRLLLTKGEEKEELEFDGEIIDLSENSLYNKKIENLEKINRKDDLAYVIYTSGTTGNPKGVMVKHSNLHNFIASLRDIFNSGFGREDKVLSLTNYVFDVSVCEFFIALTSGATLVINDKHKTFDVVEIAKLIVEKDITFTYIPPSLLKYVYEELKKIEKDIRLNKMLVGVEAIRGKILSDFCSLNRNLEIVNGYGPTEATICSTFYKVTGKEDYNKAVPIGKGLRNTKIYILDKKLNKVPVAIVGELAVSGDSVARGYLNNQELTKEKFIENPFEKGQVIYKTGDLARWLPDGNIEFLGRIDNQVKIKGFRIELGEIESNLMKIEGIKEARVLDVNKDNIKYLVAYYIGDIKYSQKELKKKLKAFLPSYMIPSSFLELDKIPLTANGKLDKNKLSEISLKLDSEIEYERPRTEVEKSLVSIWKNVLAVDRVGINDDFFSLGGDSIKSIQVISRAKNYGYYFGVKDLFNNPTIKELSKNIKEKVLKVSQEEVTGDVELTPIQKWFFEMNFKENYHWNQAMMIFSKEGFEKELLEKSFDKIVSHHDALRMSYTVINGEIKQKNRAIDENLYDLTIHDYRNDNFICEEKIKEACNKIQGSISLEKGPLVKLGLFETKDGDHLLIAIHHLVVDGVSWRIIFEDLQNAYLMAKNGEEIVLQEKSTSFKEWASKQKEYGNSYKVKKEVNYWNEIEKSKLRKLPKDKKGQDSKFSSLKNVAMELSKEETENLLKKVNKAYNTEINDILLAALALTIYKWTGEENTLINLEAHGREEIIKNVDITRTVGWFTSQYPVVLKAKKDLAETIKNTKDLLRRIPDKGINYGIIRYLANNETKDGKEFKLKPEISFNYLGQFDRDINNTIFTASTINSGESISLNNEILHLLDFSAILMNNCLNLNIIYSDNDYNEETIKALSKNYKANLIEIINHCISKEIAEKTAADITEENISLDELKPYLKCFNNIKDIYPLSSMQEGMLYHALLDEESEAYHEVVVLTVKGELDINMMEISFNKLIKRHDILRTIFDNKNFNKNMQVVFEERKAKIDYIDKSNELIDEQIYLQRLIAEDKKNKFKLNKDILIRLKVVRTQNDIYKLILSNHHIILDGWCLSILISELFKIYNQLKFGQDAMLKEVSSYSNYIKWIKNKNEEEAENYWENYLLDYNEVAKVPFENEDKKDGYKNSEINYILDESISSKLEKIARDNKVTINNIIQSLWAILLQKYNNSNDIVFGYVVSGRNAEVTGIENMLGLFINTIPLRVKLADNFTFKDLLENINKSYKESNEYDYYPLGKIQQLSEVKDRLINNIMIFENYPIENESKYDKKEKLEILSLDGFEETNYDFNIMVAYKGVIGLKFQFNEFIYSKENVEKIKNHFINLINTVIQDENILIQDIEVLQEEERNKVLIDFNNSKVNYEKDKTISELFESKLWENEDNIAVVFERESLSYKELNERVNSLARKLRNLGIKRNEYVVISTERSLEMVIGILAIVKAGAAYVPVDPNYPEERISYILSDCKPKAILSYKSTIRSQEIEIIDLASKDIYEENSSVLENINSPEDILYLIYTSGTTGKPKGVMVKHSNIVNYSANNEKSILATVFKNGLTKMGSVTNMTFDIFATEIWLVLLNGMTTFIANNDEQEDVVELSNFIERNSIEILQTTPSRIKILLSKPERLKALKSLKYIMVGGEKVDSDIVKKLHEYTEATIENVYGPSETTVWSTAKELSRDKDYKNVPIGKPIANTEVYILQGLALCSIGIAGELCIAGDGVAKGYLNKPELTKDKFIDNPYGKGKLYRTGDLARWLPNGDLEYLGRMDEQVKIRGFRIELGEISNVLRGLENIEDAVVIVRENKVGEKDLYGYIISSESVDLAEIRKKIRKDLPEYMIPSYMMQIDKIPVNKSGKLDKKALPEIVEKSRVEYIAARTKIEKIIVEIFEEVTGLEKISVDENFFEIGGHSLRATKVANRIEAETGVRIPLKVIFTEKTVEAIARYVENTENNRDDIIEKAKEKKFYPMSATERRIYLLWQMDKQSTVYNMPICYELDGEVNVEKIKVVLEELINRHEILRTAFVIEDGELVQKILSKVELDYSYEEKEEEIKVIIKNFVKAFNLENGELLRAKVIKKKGKYYLLLDIHHIVSDGMSMGIFIREFSSLYNGKTLEKLKLQYKDYSEWMRTRNLESQREYWLSKFEEEVPVIDLPYDYNRPLEQSYEGALVSTEIEKEIKEGIEKLCANTGTTEYMVLLAVFMVTLNKYSNQEDIVVGTAISGRINKDIESMLGVFINTLAIREKIETNKSFEEFLSKVKESCLKSYENQEYPFEDLVEAIDVRRDFSRNPLFDVMFNFQNNDVSELSMENVQIKPVWGEHRISKFDLSLIVENNKDTYYLLAEYSTALFKKDSIDRFLSHYKEILVRVIENSQILIREIRTITKEEEEILNNFNNSLVEYDSKKSVIEIFEKQVESFGENKAIVFENEELSYERLNEKATALAIKLRNLGIKRNEYVVISAERSLEMVIGILAIVKAGAAYVPVDPNYPEERINYILSDCKPKAILSYKSTIRSEGIEIIDLASKDIYHEDSRNLENINSPEDTLYLIYTSGTTGKPKGVMVKHSNIVNYSANNEKSILATVFKNGLTKMGSVTNMTFDIFATEIWLVFLNGMTTFIANSDEQEDVVELGNFIERNSIEILQSTPSRIKILLSDPERLKTFKSLRHIMVGGEKVGMDIVKKLHQYTNAIVQNVYGPSETTVWSTSKELSREESYHNVPIGRPIANTEVYIIQGLKLCGIGVPGELCIAGDGVTKGYLNKEELTAEKFIDNPYGKGKLYRTGDLARWLPNGDLEYLGRMDEQVKIRGFRIELGEIANVLRSLDNIEDAVVIVRENKVGEKSLYSYVISNETVDFTEVIKEIRKDLPEYMIPSYMMQIDKIPVNKSGKLDKNALPQIVQESKELYVPPETEKEKIICSIFEEILEVSKVGLEDNFFNLGGDSIKLLRLISKLRKEGINVTFNHIKRSNTIKALIEILNDTVDRANEKNEKEVEVNRIPLFKEEKEDFKKSIIYKELSQYNKNQKEAKKDRCYSPLKVQQDFLYRELPFISALAIEIKGDVSKNELIETITNIIIAQGAMRTVYDNKKDVLVELTKENWYIPYIERKNFDEAYEYVGGIFDSTELFDLNELLSKVMILEKDENTHLVFFYVNHALWDFMTSEILLNMIKDSLINSKKSFEADESYYDYVNRIKKASKSVELYDSIDNIRNLVENYKDILKAKYSKVSKVMVTKEINSIERKKIVENPIEWALEKYCKIIDLNNVRKLPFTMVHHARSGKTLNTLGLYADSIPCLYDLDKKEIKGWNKSNDRDDGLYKEIIPRESNIFEELSINITIADSNNDKFRKDKITILENKEINDIDEEIYIHLDKDSITMICPFYDAKGKDEIIKKAKEIFNLK